MLFREIGRYLASTPFLPSALAVQVAIGGGNPELALLICIGERRGGLVVGGSRVDVADSGLTLPIDTSGADLIIMRVDRARDVTIPEREGVETLAL